MQMPRKPIAFLVGALLPVIGFVSSLTAAAGDLDITFDGDGKVVTPIGSRNDYANSIALQADGKLVVSGYANNGLNNDIAVVRYNTNGSLDTSFDGDGKATLSTGVEEAGQEILVQADGKIVVGGYIYVGANANFAAVRYNTNGTLDTSFDGDGMVTTSVSSSSSSVGYGAVLQSDGKLIVIGTSYSAGTNLDLAAVRYNTNGTLDTSFDSDGKVTTAVSSGNDVGYATTLQSDGKLIVAGSTYNGTDYDVAVVRYNTDGSLDTTFDSDGINTTQVGASTEEAYDVTVQTDGKIVVVGKQTVNGMGDVIAMRYNTDGSLDTTFDSDGIITTQIGASHDAATEVNVQSDGKLLVTCHFLNGSNYDFAVVRYNTNGTLDTTFDSDGIITTQIGSGNDISYGAVLQPDGKLATVGHSHNGTNNDFAVVRYEIGTSISTTTTSTSSTTSSTTTSSSTTSTTSTTTSTTSTTPPTTTTTSPSTTTTSPTTSTSTSTPSLIVTPTSTTVLQSPTGAATPVSTTTPSSQLTPTTSSSVSVPLVTTTSTVPVDMNADNELTEEQSDKLASTIDAQNGGVVLLNGKVVDTQVSTTKTTFSISAYGANLTVRCYDADGSDIPMSADSRFELTQDDSIELIASGFKPGSDIVATVYSKPVLLGTIKADATGAGVQRWKVPDSLKAGLHTLVASGDLAQVDNAVFGLRIVVDDAPFFNRMANNWVIRLLLLLAVFSALLIPARLRRREEEESPEDQMGLSN